MWCKLEFKKTKPNLILLWSQGNPTFDINKVTIGHFYWPFSFVLVAVEIFECFNLNNTFCGLPIPGQDTDIVTDLKKNLESHSLEALKEFLCVMAYHNWEWNFYN